MGNVANVVTECHRAPSWSIGTLQGVDGEVGDGDGERGCWEIYRRSGQPRKNWRLMARGRAGYLLPVGATM